MAELLSTMAEATLTGGLSIVLEAIDPTTGAAITGVKVTNVAIYCDVAVIVDTSPGPGGQGAVPSFIPIPNKLFGF